MRKRLLELSLGLLLVAGPAEAAQVSVSDAWIRSLPGNLPAGGYFTIKNLGKSEIELTGAQSPGCGMLMLHKSSDAGGMGSMSDVESIVLAPGASVSFAPGGYHLMCMDPASSLKPGSKVPVTLQFSDKTTYTTTFAVKNARGK